MITAPPHDGSVSVSVFAPVSERCSIALWLSSVQEAVFSVVGDCGQMFGFWSEVDLTIVSHLEAAQRPCGQRGALALTHAVLEARRGLCAWPVGRMG